jgi:hypothetical protein
MIQIINILPLLSLLHFGNAAPASSLIQRQNTGCSAYTIINTRGTTEPQAESSGFITMNKAIRSAIPGVETYNTVYPADSSQTSSVGTEDIISHITSVLSTDPGHCFVLEGYSQGAKSTVQAMPSLTGEMFDAVKAVFLIGNPYHKAGLACNVDLEGGGSTLDVDGKSLTADNAIPDNWVEKTMDVCNKVCPPLSSFLSYLSIRLKLMIRVMEFAIPPMARKKSRMNIPLTRGIPKCKT